MNALVLQTTPRSTFKVAIFPESIAALPALKFIYLANNKLVDFPFEALPQWREHESANGDLLLRVLSLEGNAELEKTRAIEISASRARLVKPWAFNQ